MKNFIIYRRLIMKNFIVYTLLIFLVSCSTVKDMFEPKSKMDKVHEYHRPLEKQRLIPRPGYEGRLTNRVCTKWYGGNCEEVSIREYSLKDKSVRKRLIKFNFACHIGGKRYRICPDKAGFCRREKHEECIKWGRKSLFNNKRVCKEKKYWTEEPFVPVSDYQFLLDGATECQKGL